MPLSSKLAGNRVAAAALALAAFSAGFGPATPTFAAGAALVKPATLIVDQSLPRAQADAQMLAARRYDTFWTTSDESLARAALSPGFMDRTLPPGRPQGIEGPLAASKVVHAAVPDIHCDVTQMIVAGDRVVSHLHFTGHFTGEFKGVTGKGQAIDFMATDIYRVADGRIAENWHLEDNLTFLQQLGVIAQ
ncbi:MULTISPECIES: ester cyclase [Burkholderiaceae]|uniref:Phosphonate ABC transporter phosphate-binding periplasmic component n=1 Tax=Caballeronia sordidicola TaxID=196367 RepID=A0A242M2Y7_CABSO|nr:MULTISPECIES: ester cyclase [Burkholderiaceae]AMH43655.1 polyketide cyclase [Burkholderia sp. PAMC 26561]OTP65483.1 Phosphonate ABC transporter phosphate-binding periplasmic component [Caballeronia sordidicola]